MDNKEAVKELREISAALHGVYTYNSTKLLEIAEHFDTPVITSDEMCKLLSNHFGKKVEYEDNNIHSTLVYQYFYYYERDEFEYLLGYNCKDNQLITYSHKYSPEQWKTFATFFMKEEEPNL